jgi:hypothetical protein
MEDRVKAYFYGLSFQIEDLNLGDAERTDGTKRGKLNAKKLEK